MTMTLEERLQYCKICLNRKINPAIGLVCNLTNEKPAFEGKCGSMQLDKPEADRLIQQEKEARMEQESSGSFSTEQKGIQKGVLGGVLMIVIAIVWFVAGMAADRIFFYPPVLFCIGIYAVFKGLASGNIYGNKK